jgi:hypothetical protein
MADHESRCFHNPEKRACATCRHFEKQSDGNGMEGTPYNHEWVNLLCHAKDDEMNMLQNNCELYEVKP